MIVLIFCQLSVVAQSGYKLKVTQKPVRNEYVYLGHYYGKKLPIIDSALLNDKSEGVFSGPKKLGEGIYFISNSRKSKVSFFLINTNQQFSILADTTQGPGLRFVSSPENSIYATYLDSIRKQTVSIQSLSRKLTTKDPDSLQLRNELNRQSNQLRAYRKSTIAQYPNTLLSDMLKAALDPELPDSPMARNDPQYAARYMKAHYWDAIKFYDDRMLRTNFFEPKLDFYLSQLVAPVADSVNTEIDRMMASAVVNKETEQFMLTYFINRYAKPKNAWDDRVYLHVYERYLANRDYPWLTEPLRKSLTERAYTVMATTKGKPATDIELPDHTGKKTTLSSTQAPYTLLVFWSPTCGHCQAMLPVLDSLYRTSWKAQGIRIFAVAIETDGTRADWTSTIDKKQLADWTHVYYTQSEAQVRREQGLPDFGRVYDVQAFPTLYLLDKEKHIMARKINLAEIEKILQEQRKKRN